MRPSGARAIAVGFVRPEATSESVKPAGTVAPLATCALATKSNDTRIHRADFMRTSRVRFGRDEKLGRRKRIIVANVLKSFAGSFELRSGL
jgi:hypothetical protein